IDKMLSLRYDNRSAYFIDRYLHLLPADDTLVAILASVFPKHRKTAKEQRIASPLFCSPNPRSPSISAPYQMSAAGISRAVTLPIYADPSGEGAAATSTEPRAAAEASMASVNPGFCGR